jgi:E3 ubiquitin-protein ligase HUWE1
VLTDRGSFNQMDLPEYTTRDMLHKRLMFAITEGNTGFGFG